MTLNVDMDWGKGHSLLTVCLVAIIMEISVELLPYGQATPNTPGYSPKGLYILQERNMLKHVHGCSVHSGYSPSW